jgi:hypothetical protein
VSLERAGAAVVLLVLAAGFSAWSSGRAST